MKEPKWRKPVSMGFRLAAIVCIFMAGFVFDEADTVIHLKFMMSFIFLVYMAQAIRPIKSAPWEPDFKQMWEKTDAR